MEKWQKDREIERKKKEGTRVRWGYQRTKNQIKKFLSNNIIYLEDEEEEVPQDDIALGIILKWDWQKGIQWGKWEIHLGHINDMRYYRGKKVNSFQSIIRELNMRWDMTTIRKAFFLPIQNILPIYIITASFFVKKENVH